MGDILNFPGNMVPPKASNIDAEKKAVEIWNTFTSEQKRLFCRLSDTAMLVVVHFQHMLTNNVSEVQEVTDELYILSTLYRANGEN